LKNKNIKWIFIGIVAFSFVVYRMIIAFIIDPNTVGFWIVFSKEKNTKAVIIDRCSKIRYKQCLDIIENNEEVRVGINSKESDNISKNQIENELKTGMKNKIWNGSKLTVSNVTGFDTTWIDDFGKMSTNSIVNPKYSNEVDFSINIDSVKLFKKEKAFEVRVYLDENGRKLFSELTRSSIDKQVGVKIDSTLLIMPIVKTEINDGQIPIYLEKPFSEAADIANAIEQRIKNEKLTVKRVEM